MGNFGFTDSYGINWNRDTRWNFANYGVIDQHSRPLTQFEARRGQYAFNQARSQGAAQGTAMGGMMGLMLGSLFNQGGDGTSSILFGAGGALVGGLMGQQSGGTQFAQADYFDNGRNDGSALFG